MKRILLILFLLVTLLNVRAQQIITAQLTVTNGTVPGETFVINSSSFVWTNQFLNPCTQIMTNSTKNGSASNLWTTIISCPQSGVNVSYSGTNRITFTGIPGGALSLTLSSGWGTNVYSTNSITAATVVRVPPSAVGLYEKTNVESGLATYLGGAETTNTVPTNAPMFAPWNIWISSLNASGASGIWSYDAANDNFWNKTNTEPVAGGHSFILSGTNNSISVFTGYTGNGIVGGNNNLIGGGFASSEYDTILNGNDHQINGTESTIINGSNNVILGAFGFIGNGKQNTLGAGFYSTIDNGWSNVINGSFSWAGGFDADIENNGVFMWSDIETNKFTSQQDNVALFRVKNGMAINTNNTSGYGLNVAGSVEAEAYFLNGVPLGTGSGSGGTNITTGSGSVQSLYSVAYNPNLTSFLVSTISMSVLGGPYVLANGTYYPNTNSTYSLNYGGANYTFYGLYTNANSVNLFWNTTVQTGYQSYAWELQQVGYGGFPFAWNYDFNIVDPAFGPSWENLSASSVTTTPSFSNLSGNSAATVVWGLGDNWSFTISGTNYFSMGLAQDWKATDPTKVEYHKIFLTSSTNATLNFKEGTNQWIWQNRQGLAAVPPATISSNETITLSLSHQGGQTNWFTSWDTSLATNGITGTGTGLTVTNWTTLSSPNGFYLTNVWYTCTNGPSIFFGTAIPVSGNTAMSVTYTNNGIGYSNYIYGVTGGGSALGLPISFPLNSGSTFMFQSFSFALYVTNAQIWQLPH